MKELKLSADDFHHDCVMEGPGGPYVPLTQANSILAKKLAECPRVYGQKDFELTGQMLWQDEPFTYATHQATLVDIKPVGGGVTISRA